MPVSRVSCRYPGPRESVHIKLLVSPVSFSHNNVRLLMVYSPYGKFAYRAVCRFRDLACTESDGRTDGQTRTDADRRTDGQNCQLHAREG